MHLIPMCLAATFAISDNALGPGNHSRSLTVDGRKRAYTIHIPPNYDRKKATPVVLAFHGAAMNRISMQVICGLNKTADREKFVVVYPDGTGIGIFLAWNAGGYKGNMAKNKADDVKFTRKLLDDLATLVNVDRKRVYATGLSNGAMMCYRLAAELSDRIAAIAPVAGTMAIDKANPKRPVPRENAELHTPLTPAAYDIRHGIDKVTPGQGWRTGPLRTLLRRMSRHIPFPLLILL